jgi:hypothetical protein
LNDKTTQAGYVIVAGYALIALGTAFGGIAPTEQTIALLGQLAGLAVAAYGNLRLAFKAKDA